MSDGSATVLHVGGASPYDVVVGRELLDRLPGLLGEAPERVALVHPESLGDLARRVRAALTAYDVHLLPVPDGEAAKTASVASDCWETLGRLASRHRSRDGFTANNNRRFFRRRSAGVDD